MHANLVPSVQLLKASEMLFQRATSDLGADQWFKSPEGTNPMIWLAGHLTMARHGLLQICGVKAKSPWPQDVFGRHSKVGAPETCPPAEEVLAAWKQVGERISQRLSELSEEELQAQLPSDLPLKDKSRLSLITFLSYHEGYHIGQMATLRKWLGLGGLIDG